MMPLPHIPGYDLLTPLGGGLLTAVYTARELDTDVLRAVKVLRPDWEDQPTAIQLLQREARASLAVQHSHLPALRQAHVMKPPYFLVMDLLPGESLRRRLRRDYQLPVREAVWIARQVSQALAALHQAGFLHGDVKPDNIHLTGDGNAVLIDLGFAHRPGENASILEKGYILGTVDYLAPEMCGAELADGQPSDLFSLGVTLFEMLTGQLPYPRGTVRQVLRCRQSDPPADIRRWARGLPPALVRLVTRLLARRPDERPPTLAVVRQLIALEIATLQKRKVA
jgi:serine/threonine protein kinase